MNWLHMFWLDFLDQFPRFNKSGDRRMREFNKQRMFSGGGHPGPITPWQEVKAQRSKKKKSDQNSDADARILYEEEAAKKEDARKEDDIIDVDVTRLDGDAEPENQDKQDDVRVIGLARILGEWTRKILSEKIQRVTGMFQGEQRGGYWGTYVKMTRDEQKQREWKDVIDIERRKKGTHDGRDR